MGAMVEYLVRDARDPRFLSQTMQQFYYEMLIEKPTSERNLTLYFIE
jgi:hypothetical protein